MAAKAGRLQIQLALDVADLRRDLDTANAQIKRMAGSWQTSLKGFAAGMSQVFSGQALLQAVNQFGAAVKATIDDMGDIADGAAKLGDSAEMFQGLRAAAEQCGVAIDDVSGASNKLQLQLGKIQSGGGKEANDALAKLHLTLNDLKGLSPGDAFIKAAGALGDVGDKSQQAAIGAALFGKSWASLKPLIADGADGLREAVNNAAKATDGAVAAGDAFGDAMAAMHNSTKVFIEDALEPVLPPLTELAKALSMNSDEAADTAKEFSFFGDITKQVARGVLEAVAVFKIASVTVHALGETIGASIGFMVESFSALNKAGNMAQDPRNIFNGSAWQTLKDGVGNAKETFLGMFHDTEAAAQHSLDKITSDTADGLKAIAAATAHVTPPKPPKTGDQDGATDSTKKHTEAVKADNEAQKEAEAWARRLSEWFDKWAAQQKELANLQNDITDERMRQNGFTEEAIRLARLDTEQADDHTRALSDLGAEYDRVKKAGDEQRDAAAKARDAQKAEIQGWQDVLASGFDDIFQSMTEGAASATDAIKRLLVEIAKMIALKAATQWVNSLFPAKDGAAFNSAGVRFFAQGGVVNSPTAFAFAGGNLGVMGEAGPEAIMPLKRGADGKLGVAGGGNVQVFNYAGAAISVERDRDNVRILVDQVTSKIAADIARGGSTVSGAIERAYKVRR